MKSRFFVVLLFLCISLISGNAQEHPLSLPAQDAGATDQWAVRLEAGVNADALAASLGYINSGQIGTLEGWYLFRATDATTADATRTLGLRGAAGVLQVEPQFTLRRTTRSVETHIKDPLFKNQWHINNTKVGLIGEDANVLGAWNFSPLCCDGTGVVVASVDDGVWWANPDLKPNYRADLSYDFLQNDTNAQGGWHGTAVAGVMAAADDGIACGVGLAYNAGIAGLRMLGLATTDAVEAASLGYLIDDIHVYNNSWGPYDDGIRLEGPGPLALTQMQESITNGRGGLGTIYVWANGNGLDIGDDSNADGYTNQIFTISVAATDDSGEQSWYSEPGANLLINAPSSGGTRDIVTTGYNASSCTKDFGGTSSAAPLVGGVVALMLQANPNLTWRDVQYILMQTADLNDPTDTEWAVNAAGYMFNPKYGFGRVDTAEAVAYAAMWDGVPDTLATVSSGMLTTNLPITDAVDNTPVLTSTTTTIASAMQLEQVEVQVNYTHLYRGDLEFILVSPSGTRSTLLRSREFDENAMDGLWHLSSNQFWGETSVGTWTLEIRDYYTGDAGVLNQWQLDLHGISQDPAVVGQSSDFTTLNGRDVTLQALTVDMPGTTYAWYEVDGITETVIPSETTSTLTVAAPTSEAATYRFKATTGATTVTSDDFTVVGAFEKTLTVNSAMDANPARPKEALGWLRLSAAGNDKVMCEGLECSFRFVSSPTEKTQIRQYIDLNNVDLNANDALTLSVAAKGTARAQLRLTVYYSDGSSEFCKAPLPPAAEFTTNHCFVVVDDKVVTEIVAQVMNKTKIQGKRIQVDNVHLNWSLGLGREADNPTFALPTAPDGFRDNK